MKKEVLRMERICVNRKGSSVLDDFKLNIYEGECCVVFGFNGSGIRELGEIFSGRLIPDSGRIIVNENDIPMDSYFLSEPKGVYVIDKDMTLMPDLTVAENLFFGEISHYLNLRANTKQQEAYADRMLSRFGVEINVKRKGRDLTFYESLMVSLVRAHAHNARLIVFTDPPEIINIRKGSRIIDILKRLKELGVSILWIGHHFESVSGLLDGIFVVRNGRTVRTVYHEEYSLDEIINTAENRMSADEPDRPKASCSDEAAVELEKISCGQFTDLSLRIKKGQVTGLSANEPEVLAKIRDIICGEETDYTGNMMLGNEEYRPADLSDAVARGVQMIDIMRYENHVMPRMSVVDNMLLQNYWIKKPRLGRINKSWQKHMESRIRQRHRDWNLDVWGDLEPWQQQILLLERCLYQPGKLYLIAEPFATFNRETVRYAVSVLKEMIRLDKTVILLSMSIQDLTMACAEINIIRNRKLSVCITSDEYE